MLSKQFKKQFQEKTKENLYLVTLTRNIFLLPAFSSGEEAKKYGQHHAVNGYASFGDFKAGFDAGVTIIFSYIREGVSVAEIVRNIAKDAENEKLMLYSVMNEVGIDGDYNLTKIDCHHRGFLSNLIYAMSSGLIDSSVYPISYIETFLDNRFTGNLLYKKLR